MSRNRTKIVEFSIILLPSSTSCVSDDKPTLSRLWLHQHLPLTRPRFSDLTDDLPERVDFPNFCYPNLPKTSCISHYRYRGVAQRITPSGDGRVDASLHAMAQCRKTDDRHNPRKLRENAFALPGTMTAAIRARAALMVNSIWHV